MELFQLCPGLLEPFRNGHQDALERVYRTYVRPVERYLRSLARRSASDLNQPSAIADLLQDVFTKAFATDARRSFDGQRDYGPYLSAIARNCFIDALRARGREVLKRPEDMPTDLDDVPEPTLDRDPNVIAVLTTYLHDLSPELRGVYEQRFVLGKSQDDASTALGLSRRTVRTIEDRLRKGLRKELARAGISLRELGAPERPRPAPLRAVAIAQSEGES